MTKSNGAISVLTAEVTFLNRFNTNQEQSRLKVGTDGINTEIEWYADLVDALVYTAVDTLTSAALEKFLRDFTDVLDTSKNLSDLAADSVRDNLSAYRYNNKDKFDDTKSLNPFNTLNDNSQINPDDIKPTPNPDDGSTPIDPDNPNPNNPDPLNPPTPTNPDDGIPPKDPTPPRRDPLVLDTDKDGFISTVALKDANTYTLKDEGVKSIDIDYNIRDAA